MPEITTKIKDVIPPPAQLKADFQDRLSGMFSRVKAGLSNLADFTFMLHHEGKPLSLDGFEMFKDMFDALPVPRLLLKTGRQVAKTTSGCAANIIERVMRPYTKALIVTPLFSQVHRISAEVAAPMLQKSLFRDEIMADTAQQVLKRRYRNGSVDHYSYAFIDALRIRSVSGIDRLWLDEIQDIRAELLPVIEQVQAARPLTAWKWYSGTPLSMGNLIQTLWGESSQAEEAILCPGCHKLNIACTEQDLLQMIGPTSVICAKCGKTLDISTKTFIPRFPDREELFAGRHITQVLHPLHVMIPKQWKELRRNLAGLLSNSSATGYTVAQAYNEILGESFDSADRMIDHPALRAACQGGPNTLEHALKEREKLAVAAIGVDWGGGGDGFSFTKIILGGIKAGSSTFKVLFMTTLPQSMPPQAQVPQVLKLVERFKPNILAHDYTGIGWLFESLGLSWDLEKELIWPFTYGFNPSREVIYSSDTIQGTRSSLRIDHTRSLFALYTMIKAGKVLFPDYAQQVNPDNGERPVDDFLHMFAEAHRGLRGGELLYVKKDGGHSDDYVHATNFAASACWYAAGSYPQVPEDHMNGIRLVHTEEEAAMQEGQWAGAEEPDPVYVA